MEQLTTYTVKSKNSDNVWIFKYDLNGFLKEFNRLEGELSEIQIRWFFVKGNFPYDEQLIKSWRLKLKANFEITIGESDLSFEALWNLYDHKVKRVEAEKQFSKLKEADVIKCFLSIKGYNKYLQKKGTGKAHLSTFINQRYFEDEWQKA